MEGDYMWKPKSISIIASSYVGQNLLPNLTCDFCAHVKYTGAVRQDKARTPANARWKRRAFALGFMRFLFYVFFGAQFIRSPHRPGTDVPVRGRPADIAPSHHSPPPPNWPDNY